MKSERKRLMKKTDNEWSRVIRQVGYCERCHNSDCQLHPHHLILRRNYAYRHDLSNGVCLCASCHTLASYSAHRDKTNFLEWLKRERKGQWEWFREHTIEVPKEVGGEIVITYSSLPAKHLGDEEEYKMLKAM